MELSSVMGSASLLKEREVRTGERPAVQTLTSYVCQRTDRIPPRLDIRLGNWIELLKKSNQYIVHNRWGPQILDVPEAQSGSLSNGRTSGA